MLRYPIIAVDFDRTIGCGQYPDIVLNPVAVLQPMQLSSRYGLALKTTQFEADKTLDAFFDLSRAQSVEQAFEATREVRAMPLRPLSSPMRSISAGK